MYDSETYIEGIKLSISNKSIFSTSLTAGVG